MKLEILDAYTHPGKDCNEDAFAVNENYLFVLDGATCLTDTHVSSYKTDAKWFSHVLRDRLCEAFDKHDNRELKYIVYDIVEDLKHEYLTSAKEKNIEIPVDSPSSGVAIFRVRDNNLEFFGLGDCVGVIEFKSGKLLVTYDDVLPLKDDEIINRMVELAKENNIDVIDAFPLAMDVIKDIRGKRNTPTGYNVLDLKNESTLRGRTFSFPLDDVVSIAAFSDGFDQLVDTFHFYDGYEKLLNAMKHIPLKDLAENLFSLQEMDAGGNKYPRIKFRDDTTSAIALIK